MAVKRGLVFGRVGGVLALSLSLCLGLGGCGVTKYRKLDRKLNLPLKVMDPNGQWHGELAAYGLDLRDQRGQRLILVPNQVVPSWDGRTAPGLVLDRNALKLTGPVQGEKGSRVQLLVDVVPVPCRVGNGFYSHSLRVWQQRGEGGVESHLLYAGCANPTDHMPLW